MKQTSINVTALGLEEEALEASYWHKGLCKLINGDPQRGPRRGDLYVDPEDFHLVMENLEEESPCSGSIRSKQSFFAG